MPTKQEYVDLRCEPWKHPHHLKVTMTMKTEQRAAHTPGPWFIDDNFIVPKESEDGSKNGAIADVFGDDELQQAANARLISAAPELLAACEKLTGILERHEIVLPDGGRVEGKYLLALDSARAAISKAKGQQ